MELRKNILSVWDNIVSIYKKHSNLFTVLGLGIIFYLIFFHNLGNYSLMDVDETRYVAMARDMFNSKDFLTLYLNGQYFFEKPPLYFWQEALSFAFWGGKINEFTARFPVALLGFILSFSVYFTSKKIVNRNFGILTSLILATSLEFVILAKYAILDIVLTFYIGLSILSYFQVYFCQEKNKKYFWWLFYIFSALAVMAKGIPGFVIPFGTVFFTSIIAKKFKEIFKPIFILPGIVLFLLITLPWHIIMFNKYNPLFFNEYIIKHHLHRFLNTENNEIGRKQPFYYYFVVILWGFLPWTFSTIAVLVEKIKALKNYKFIEKIKSFDFNSLDNINKLAVLSVVCVLWIFFFFSSSTTKLATYLLPVYMPLALVVGIIWKNYIEQNLHEKAINISAKIFGWICLVAGIVAIFAPLFLPKQLAQDISDVKGITIFCLIFVGICSLLSIKFKKYVGLFISYVVFICLISAFGTHGFFEVDYKFGQNDLIKFAKIAKHSNYSISAFGMKRKYSLLYYREQNIDYNEDEDFTVENVEKDLKKKDNVVIIRNKEMNLIENKLKYDVLEQGRRYTMIKGSN